MAVRHRCLAVSRPRGVRVGLSAALRGPFETRGGYSRAPRNRIVPVKRPFSASPTARGPPLRRPHGLQSRQPACSRRVAVPSRLPLPAAGPPRARRRFQRRLGEARLPSGKTLDSFDFSVVPTLSKAHVMALCGGHRWLDEGSNLLLIGPPGTGKTHLSAAIGLALIEHGYRVLFARTTDLAQRLQAARRELALEAAVRKLDKFHLLVLDYFSYVTKDQAETSVLFELISARYEQRSLLITANQPFGEWDRIFPSPP